MTLPRTSGILVSVAPLSSDPRFFTFSAIKKTPGGAARAFLVSRLENERLVSLGVDEAFEFAGANWVLQLLDGLGFDLADAFAGDVEAAVDLRGCRCSHRRSRSAGK